MFEPIKVGFGEFMGRYYRGLSPTTAQMGEYINRGFGKSVMWAPSRMIDSAEDMLAAWQRNDTDNPAPTEPPKLPVILVAIAKDYVPSGRDFSRQIAEPVSVMLAGDDKGRHFKLRSVSGEIRAQVVVFASDEPTAKSLAAQFCLFLDAVGNRRFYARHKNPMAQDEEWPVVIESPETPFISIRTEAKNISIVAADLSLKASVPLYSAPNTGDDNTDLNGVPGTDDPSGYQVVVDYIPTPGEAR